MCCNSFILLFYMLSLHNSFNNTTFTAIQCRRLSSKWYIWERPIYMMANDTDGSDWILWASRCRTFSFFFRIPTSVRGMKVLCRCTDQRQGDEGTPQAHWPASGGCRYPASALNGVRRMQAPCRCPDQWQEDAGTLQVHWPVSRGWRYLASALTSVRRMQVSRKCTERCQGNAGTLQMPWPVSGGCRHPAGALTSARGCTNWPTESLTQFFQGMM